MATTMDIVLMLRPNIEVTVVGEGYDAIVWHSGEAEISKEEFEAGAIQYENWKKQQESEKAAKKQSLLDRLGITEEDARLLLQ